MSVNADIGLTEDQAPFFSKPFIIFSGHIADILDVSWSKVLAFLIYLINKSHIFSKKTFLIKEFIRFVSFFR